MTKPGIGVDYRNIGQVDVKVYPVDLMQLYLTRRNLNGIASIDLAGVTPLVEKTVALGNGADYDDKSKSIDLPLAKEGAYLTMIRGDNLYASGIVLVSPLEMEVLEESAAGKVRIVVRDAHTKEFVPKVQVKVIGSAARSSCRGRRTCGVCLSRTDYAGWSRRSRAREPPNMRFTAGRLLSGRLRSRQHDRIEQRHDRRRRLPKSRSTPT